MRVSLDLEQEHTEGRDIQLVVTDRVELDCVAGDQEHRWISGLIATALHWRPLDKRLRGVAPTLKGLEGTWAVPGDGYAGKLAAIGQAIQKL
jgi:hypothetical protein